MVEVIEVRAGGDRDQLKQASDRDSLQGAEVKLDELDLADCDILVIDSGAEYTRVGFSGEDEPAVEVRTVVARADGPSRVGRVHLSSEPTSNETYVGEAALAKRATLELVRPIARGIVNDWDALEAVWRECFAVVGAAPASTPVLLTEAPLSARAHREELVRRCFDAFGVQAVYVGVQPVLAAFAAGRMTALVVDLGASSSWVSPIWEGFLIPHAMRQLGVAGAQITEYLARLLTEKGHYFTTPEQLETVNEIKKELAYVALDPDLEWLRFGRQQRHDVPATASAVPRAGPTSTCSSRASSRPPSRPASARVEPPRALAARYELPDGCELELTSERFRCAEALFDPSLLGKEEPGLTQCVLSAIADVGVDIRRDLFAAVVLSGGASLTAGLDARLEADLADAAAAGVRVKVHAAEGRQLLSWQGGALLSSLPDFQQMWISRAEYETSGAACVHARCVASHAPQQTK